MIPLQAAANATDVGLKNSANSVTGLVPLIFVAIWLVVIGSLVLAARNSRHFDRLVSVGNVIAVSLYYAIHGVAAVTATAILVAPAYLFATAEPATQSDVGRYALYAVAGYTALTVIGYVFKRYLFTPIINNADEAGLLPDPDEDEEEAST